MFKIEKALLITQQNAHDIAFINVIKQFLKETNMLVSNIHLTHVHMKEDVGSEFPLDTNLYDGAWYKNLLIAAEIIIDRLHSRISENKDYLKMFDDIQTCDFVEFAKKWNKINFMVKYNVEESDWDNLCKEYNIYATSRKLEEIIAKGVTINLPLLKSISLEVDKYKSIAKNLDSIGGADYDSLLSLLAPKKMDEIVEQTSPSTETQEVSSPVGGVTTVSVIKEKAPLSPIKKEMDQILKWIKLRDEEISLWKQKQSRGYDPEEYKAINDKLATLEKEMAINEELLVEAKKLLPTDPMAKDMAQVLKWVKDREASIKKWKKQQDVNAASKEELKQIEKYLLLIEKELTQINSELQIAKSYIPVDPKAKEMVAILNWVKSRQQDIKLYKKQQAGQSINDELKLIEKELAITEKNSKEIETTIKYINSNKPVDPLKNELDELLKWVNIKNKEISAAKIAEKKLAKKKQVLLANEIKKETSDLLVSNVSKDDNLVEKKELTPPELKTLPNNLPPIPSNELKINVSEEKLLDIAEVYKVEAEVLKTAIEILPRELAKSGKKSLPQMLQHLLEEGYIEVNENYVADPKNKLKFKEVIKSIR